MTARKGEPTPELVVADLAAWRCWLADHATASDGVWLVLAKKGTTHPTSLTYDEALEEALCHGWVDGLTARRGPRGHLPAPVHPSPRPQHLVQAQRCDRRAAGR